MSDMTKSLRGHYSRFGGRNS